MEPPVIRPAASLSIIPQGSGTCKDAYVIEGQVLNRPGPGTALWLVSELYGDNPYNTKNHYYAKEQIDSQVDPQGNYRLVVAANKAREPGITKRTGRFLVVQANEEAQKKLQLDKAYDPRYQDVQREQLPVGSKEIATSSTSEQRCV